MFEIRIICDYADVDRLTNTLSGTFITGRAVVRPARDGKRARVYLDAEQREIWPDPEQAYTGAPNVRSELTWLSEREPHERDRVWWLRRAAATDRMACGLSPDGIATEEQALNVACRLMSLDRAALVCAPRAYTRQQYAHWIADQQ
ncbi:hypothetical protein SAMN04487983_105527 [Streptomyces sp. yr375]|uniref:hypothetical protein n=1 Tax=Streptomyces sp. yr375 TaxID=1761906 RepID=UPI0008CB716D|nr:hypothetical protein [Streptomyces sp. yr375]SES44338.1 hypothetical protein SAMN04487983_105527 [Streptomyces sp. yr375]